MLVLSRKQNQSIVIGEDIQIEILKVSGNTVRIGIKAPKEVKVLRGELAPFGISGEDSASEATTSLRSHESVRQEGSDYVIEVPWPMESEHSENSVGTFAAPSA